MDEKAPLLGPLLTDPARIKRQAVKRRNVFDQVSVAQSDVDAYLEDGWVVDKPLKRNTRLKRMRAPDALLENRVWMVFFLLGYHELNDGRKFSILVERKGAEPIRKQIDVFAKDE